MSLSIKKKWKKEMYNNREKKWKKNNSVKTNWHEWQKETSQVKPNRQNTILQPLSLISFVIYLKITRQKKKKTNTNSRGKLNLFIVTTKRINYLLWLVEWVCWQDILCFSMNWEYISVLYAVAGSDDTI